MYRQISTFLQSLSEEFTVAEVAVTEIEQSAATKLITVTVTATIRQADRTAVDSIGDTKEAVEFHKLVDSCEDRHRTALTRRSL